MTRGWHAVVIAVAGIASGVLPGVRADAGGWRLIYDRPTNVITSIAMFDDTDGVAIAPPGILRTTDGGRSWREPEAKPRIAEGSIAVANRVAWAGTSSGGIWRSADAGATWERQPSGTDAHVVGIAAVSEHEAWAVTNGVGFSDLGPFEHPESALLHTTDSGATWSRASVPGHGVFVDVAAADGRVWVVASRCNPGDRFGDNVSVPGCRDRWALLRSDDAGATWTLLAEEPSAVPRDLTFSDADQGYGSVQECDPGAGCGGSALYVTADGGATWERRGRLPLSGTTVRFDGADRAWSAGMSCDSGPCTAVLAASVDGGRSWTTAAEVAMPTGGYPPALAITDDSVLFSGSPAGIARYDRATQTSAATDSDSFPPMRNITFIDHATGYAIADTALARTDDGGASWRLLSTPEHVGGMAASTEAVWITAWCPTNCPPHLWRSLDGGAGWEEVLLPSNALDLWAAAGRDSLVVGTEAALYRTDDGGGTWTQIGDPYQTPRFLGATHAWTPWCGSDSCDPSFRYSSDGGRTWELRPAPPLALVLYFATPEVGFAMRGPDDDYPHGQLYRTSDAGHTWSEVDTLGYLIDHTMAFVDAEHGWAVGSRWTGDADNPFAPDTIILSTEDGGITWAVEAPISTEPPMYSSSSLLAADGRVWLTAGLSANPWGAGRTVIYRRADDSDATARTPLVVAAIAGVAVIGFLGAGSWLASRA
jgi:photosystem II stability/assembly factor-like uncharacterized protein